MWEKGTFVYTKKQIALCITLLFATSQLHAFWDYSWYPQRPKKVKRPKRKDRNKGARTYTLSEQQANEYIGLCIASLRHALPTGSDEGDIAALEHSVYSTLPHMETLFIWRFGKRVFDKDKLDQYFTSAILELVEQTSHDYTLARTNNRTVAKKIANSMLNNLLAIIQNSGTLNFEKVTPYIGRSLRQKIREAINRFDVPHQPDFSNYTPTHQNYTQAEPEPSAQVAYATQQCCICFESFQEVDEIFLRPCGHDICADCAQEWFFNNNPDNTKTCPICRSYVDLGQLWEDINHALTT